MRGSLLSSIMQDNSLCYLVIALLISPCLSRHLHQESTHQKLDVEFLLKQTKSTQYGGRERAGKQVLTHKKERSAWTLDVVHRDSLLAMKSYNHSSVSYKEKFAERIARDSVRVRTIQKKILSKNNSYAYHEHEASAYQVEAEFGSGVVSRMGEGSGEYFTRLGVGTPMREQYMVLDTGSDVSWVQCQPCAKCYPQDDPIYDPSLSATFSTVWCGSKVCSHLGDASCRGGSCTYTVSYGDGSQTKGTFATERMTFGNTIVQNVAMGCGHENTGLFVGAAGLLGLGAGPLSFASQIEAATGGVFSYCLADRYSDSYGSLIFGPGAMPPGSVVTPLLRNPAFASYYYVSLAGIIVGGSLVPIPTTDFGVDERGMGGVIIDSGTAVTRLRTEAYVAMRNAFAARTARLPRAKGTLIFDTCYDLRGMQAVSVPTVGFYFSNGASVVMAARNYMVAVDSVGTFCFAFAPVSCGPSIIGNVQQQYIRVSFDTANSLVGFAPNQC